MSSSQKDKVLDREISYEKCSKSLTIKREVMMG